MTISQGDAKKRLKATSILAGLTLGAALALMPGSAQALTFQGCAGWSDEPESTPGNHIMFAARMKCDGNEVPKTSLYRVRAMLRSEDVKFGPIPNVWSTVATSPWSSSVVRPNTAGISAIRSCSEVSTEGKWRTRGEGQLREARNHGDSPKVDDFC